MRSEDLRIAVVGSGAVTERFHLPALATLAVMPALLIDTNLQRAASLAGEYAVPSVSVSYEPHIGDMDAAIVALPHYLHMPVCTKLLLNGVHILVEKPMALTQSDCGAMIAASRQGNAILAVGQIRRFLQGARWIKAALEHELLGQIHSFDIREGIVFNWPVTSDFLLRKETAGGGVLFDTGAHVIDLLLWWLGECADFEYSDDDFGGVEADCILNLVLRNGAEGIVELSRTRDLRNTAILRGQKGILEIGLHSNFVMAEPLELLTFAFDGVTGSALSEQTTADLFVLQARDWLHAAATGGRPFVSGVDVAGSIRLIEACYRQRKGLDLPWVRPTSQAHGNQTPWPHETRG